MLFEMGMYRQDSPWCCKGKTELLLDVFEIIFGKRCIQCQLIFPVFTFYIVMRQLLSLIFVAILYR